MVRFVTLGSVAMYTAGECDLVPGATQSKRLALLAYLSSGPVHRRDTLLGVFWPELDHSRARGALTRAVYYLRQLVGRDAIRSVGRDSLMLSPERLWVDVRAFREAVEGGDQAAAVGLYGGEFLEGLFLTRTPAFEDWLDGQRRRLRLMAEEAAQHLVLDAQVQGDLHKAIWWAERSLAISPNDETAVYRLIKALARSGDRAGALQVFGHFSDRLRGEYDLEPATFLSELADRVATWPGPKVLDDNGDEEEET
jgi:DNA-binding SARP family transcriptional activator